MIKRMNRFSDRSELDRVLRKGQFWRTDLLQFKFLPSTAPDSHFAVTISKKVAHDAVPRNRLRRQIMEIIRLNLGLLTTPLSIAVIAFPPAAKADFGALEKCLLTFFKKLKPNAK